VIDSTPFKGAQDRTIHVGNVNLALDLHVEVFTLFAKNSCHGEKFFSQLILILAKTTLDPISCEVAGLEGPFQESWSRR
jgi:hypothetical protein